MSADETELLRRKLERERTARKEAEALLEAKSRELYVRNEALRQEIGVREQVEQDLADKASKLARSNEELQEFAYVASHDLQAPLRNILAFSRLLVKECGDRLGPDAEEFLGFIEEGAQSMHALINDLLNLSRVETQGGEKRPVDVTKLIDSIASKMSDEIKECGAELDYANLPEVNADETQLRQLLGNLIDNAIKFQPPGRAPKVTVSANELDGVWCFCVSDNGIGIEPAHQERIFVIFRRLHTQDEYPGTGIGLAICKKIVERHDGKMWVKSEPDRGTRFYFTLPVAGDIDSMRKQ